jgi:Domain of unknown function (DUF4258)
MDINLIRSKIRDDKYELTLHAIRRRTERKISTRDIEDVILNGEIIEEYHDDKPFPSCLIAGKTEDEWVDYKRRKKR